MNLTSQPEGYVFRELNPLCQGTFGADRDFAMPGLIQSGLCLMIGFILNVSNLRKGTTGQKY
jgi:hypothetical protein